MPTNRQDAADQYGSPIDTEVYRVSASRYAPMAIPPVSVQGAGRFDDTKLKQNNGQGHRVLYCAGAPVPAMVELLARFRTGIDDLVKLAGDTIGDVEEREQLLVPQDRHEKGIIPSKWYLERQVSSVRVRTDLPLLDLSLAATIQYVREELAMTVYALGIPDLDLSRVTDGNRRLTRAIARWVYNLKSDDGHPLFSGIKYTSRFGTDLPCYALFDGRYEIVGDVESYSLQATTPALIEAASILRLEIG